MSPTKLYVLFDNEESEQWDLLTCSAELIMSSLNARHENGFALVMLHCVVGLRQLSSIDVD